MFRVYLKIRDFNNQQPTTLSSDEWFETHFCPCKGFRPERLIDSQMMSQRGSALKYHASNPFLEALVDPIVLRDFLAISWLGQELPVCCLAHRGSTGGFLLPWS